MQKRDRKSFAVLHQVSAEYRGDFGPLTVNVGLRAPYFIRNLNNYCFTSSASGIHTLPNPSLTSRSCSARTRSMCRCNSTDNTRLLGTFARLNRRDGKPQYLRHQSRIWTYLNRSLAHPALAPAREWYAANVPPPIS